LAAHGAGAPGRSVLLAQALIDSRIRAMNPHHIALLALANGAATLNYE
jgi:hypothetical protein